MNIKNGFSLLLSNKGIFFRSVLQKLPFLSTDEFYLRLVYRLKFNKPLNLNDPKTFNEKLQWLKLYYRNPVLTTLVDKVEVKKYVADKIGHEYIIPTLGVWNSYDEIDFTKMPDQFVLKTNHDYGGVVICKNKDEFDYGSAKKKLERHLKRNFFYAGREWPYKNVKPKILAEQFMIDHESGDIRDYKFFCFNGEPKLIFIATDRQAENESLKTDFFDMDFKRLEISQANRKHNFKNLTKPKNYEKMIQLSKLLSKELPHVRVDFYEINNKIYFGELTFFHTSGFQTFQPEEWDYRLGSYLELPNKAV